MRSLPLTSAALLHPLTLSCLGLWALNDHVLKGWAPGVLTGKLSDVAGLVVAPTVLMGLLEWCLPRLVRERLCSMLAACCLAIALLALGLELSPPVMLGFRHALSAVRYAVLNIGAACGLGHAATYALVQNTPDLTDLLCLPALWAPWWLVRRAVRESGELRAPATLASSQGEHAGSEGTLPESTARGLGRPRVHV